MAKKSQVPYALAQAAATLLYIDAGSSDVQTLMSMIRERVATAVKNAPSTRPTMVEAPLDRHADSGAPSGTEHEGRLQDLINHMTPDEHAQVRDTLKGEGIIWPYSRSPKYAAKLLQK